MKLDGVEITKERAEENYVRYLDMKYHLEQGNITPREVIGGGYVKPRECALEFINQQIGTYRTLVRIMEEN